MTMWPPRLDATLQVKYSYQIYNVPVLTNLSDLVVECAPVDVNNYPALENVCVVCFGLGNEEGEILKLKRESPMTWKHTNLMKL